MFCLQIKPFFLKIVSERLIMSMESPKILRKPTVLRVVILEKKMEHGPLVIYSVKQGFIYRSYTEQKSQPLSNEVYALTPIVQVW